MQQIPRTPPPTTPTSPKSNQLLQGLAERGFGRGELSAMQRLINAERSDLFDVLAHVAYALPPLDREDRGARTQITIEQKFNDKQQAFLTLVLAQYVSVGVEELDGVRPSPLLNLKYRSLPDALDELGSAEEIRRAFISFHQYLHRNNRGP